MGKSRADTVYQQTKLRLSRLVSGDDGTVRERLANLRRGAGRMPGEDPRAWSILFSELPEEMLGQYGEPSREEWAIHTALTMFALHQQGRSLKEHSMHQEDVSLGGAAANLVAVEGGDDDARERVARRFHQIVLAQDMPTLTYYLRTFIQLLRSAEIGLDYARLAKDLFLYQFQDQVPSVRLMWGQDFYRRNKSDE